MAGGLGQIVFPDGWRHAKVIGAWGEGSTAVQASGVAGSAGVVLGDDPASVFTEVQALMAGTPRVGPVPATIT